MKLLIAGSRDIATFDLSSYVPPKTELIICGGAKGIDCIAEKYADTHKISKLIIRPRYDLYGKSAPLKRNEIMVDIADSILVIWNGRSRGTMHTIKYAKKSGKPLSVIQLYSQPHCTFSQDMIK